MAKNIFYSYATHFRELGYRVTPVHGKKAFLPDWTTWDDTLPPDEQDLEFEQMREDQRTSNSGIGIVLGQGVIVFDVDIDDQRIIDILPPTTMYKYGAKGLSAFYRVDKEVRSQPGNDIIPVELLGVGRQSVMPPSIHPKTGKPYEWRNCDGAVELFELGFLENPEAEFEKIKQFCIKNNITQLAKNIGDDRPGPVSKISVSGIKPYGVGNRNNFLAGVAYRLACDMTIDRMTEDQCVDKLLEVDQRIHKDKAWFFDPGEHSGEFVPRALADKMFKKALGSADKKGDRLERIEFKNEPGEDIEEQSIKPMYPRMSKQEVDQLIKEVPVLDIFAQYIYNSTPDYSPALALGAGLSLLSVASANICSFNGARTNLFIHNVAPSGVGKNAPQVALQNVIDACPGGQALSGFESYCSSQSIYLGFSENNRHCRIDIQDESGELFVKATDKKNGSMIAAANVLNKLFSASATKLGKQARVSKTTNSNNEKIEPVSNPFFTWMASTTHEKFRDFILHPDIVSSGVAGRCLYFIENTEENLEEELDINLFDNIDDKPPALLVQRINELFAIDVQVEGSETRPAFSTTLNNPMAKIIAYKIPKAPGVPALLNRLCHQLRLAKHECVAQHNFGDKFAKKPPLFWVLSRASDVLVKLAALWWVGTGRPVEGITVDGLNWAYRVLLCSLGNIEELIITQTGNSSMALVSARVSAYLQHAGDRGVRNDNFKKWLAGALEDIYGTKTRPSDVKQYFDSLLADEVICYSNALANGKKVVKLVK